MSVKKLVAGKHSCVGHLSSGDAGSAEGQLDKAAMLVYVGDFESMDGPVEITEAHIDAIVASHNAKLSQFVGKTEDEVLRAMPPMQLDHSTSAAVTVGRAIGELYKGTFTREDGETVPALFSKKLRTLGRENVEKVADGRWVNLSIGADLDAGTLNEVSIVAFPAAPHAALLARMGEDRGEVAHLEQIPEIVMDFAVNVWGEHTADRQEALDYFMDSGMSKQKAQYYVDRLNSIQRNEQQKIDGKHSPGDGKKKFAAWKLADGDRVKMAKVVWSDNYKGHVCSISEENGKFTPVVGGQPLKQNIYYSVSEAKEAIKKYVAGNLSRFSEGETMETKEEIKARHLAEKQALSGQHQEELKTHKLEEVKGKHDEALRKLQEKHSEELKKLGIEPEVEHLADDVTDTDGDNDGVKDAEQKLAAAKPKMVALAKGFAKEAKGVRLAVKTGLITTRLAKLQSQAKITPAERKKINLAKLAEEKDEVIEARLKAYDEREPVIDPRVYGTTRATNLASLKKRMDSIRLSAETKTDMGMPLSEDEKKVLAGEQVAMPSAAQHQGTEQESMSHLASLLGEHPAKDEVMAYCKKLMEGRSHLAEEEKTESLAEAESTEKHMSALAETVNRLQTKNEELTALIGEVFGLKASDLTE